MLFIDTKFTDQMDCDLISIGIVSDDGREFCAERSDVDLSRCSDFARAVVLPQLGREPAIVGTEREISASLLDWLMQFGPIKVCFDHPTDFEWFYYLTRDPQTLVLPGWIEGRNIRGKLARLMWNAPGRRTGGRLIMPCMTPEETGLLLCAVSMQRN